MVSGDTDDYYNVDGYYKHKDEVLNFFTSRSTDEHAVILRINGIDDDLTKLLHLRTLKTPIIQIKTYINIIGS